MCCVLCALSQLCGVCCVVFAVCCVLAVWCVLCAVCCVLCPSCVVCGVWCVVCGVCCVLCASCVLCAVCCVLCAVCLMYVQTHGNIRADPINGHLITNAVNFLSSQHFVPIAIHYFNG